MIVTKTPHEYCEKNTDTYEYIQIHRSNIQWQEGNTHEICHFAIYFMSEWTGYNVLYYLCTLTHRRRATHTYTYHTYPPHTPRYGQGEKAPWIWCNVARAINAEIFPSMLLLCRLLLLYKPDILGSVLIFWPWLWWRLRWLQTKFSAGILESSVDKRWWRLYILSQYHADQTQPIKYKENPIFAIFESLLTA